MLTPNWRTFKNIRKNQIFWRIIIFIIATSLCTLIFYLRFPNIYANPNFYAEDSFYAMNILNSGFENALLTPFNGYPIMGTYLLHGVSQVINALLFTGNIVTLPQSISIVSYVFMGMSVALPILLLNRLLHPLLITWLIFVSAFVPLPVMEYGILGSAANIKFIFLYITVLLIIYRHNLRNEIKKYIAIDTLLLVACLTNIIACALIPFAFIKYVPLFRFEGLKKAIRQPSFISFAVLSVFIFILGIFTLTNGVDSIGGIYDKPYQWPQTVEVFFARSYLFGYLYIFYQHLTDLRVIILMALFIIFSLYFTWKKYRFETIFSLASVTIVTALILKGRPGISSLFDSYLNGGYDQYFYAQNIISYLACAFVFMAITLKIKSKIIRILVLIIPFIILPTIVHSSSYGSNNFMAERRGTIIENLTEACKANTNTLKIATYPVNPFTFTFNKSAMCKGINNEKEPVKRTKIEPNSKGVRIYMPGHVDKFTQSFKSEKDNLKGLSFEVVTYSKLLFDNYKFKLMDASCRKDIYTTRINSMKVTDNSYYPVRFPPLGNTKDKTYCFSVEVVRQPSQPFAINLTDDYAYKAGVMQLNGKMSNRDIVFSLAY
jgi:hypothetical protein